ncbi:MAG: alpha/beta hydrolase-fold protein [Colwellia sp.]|nr:alpha/beta hydrolase-fold protein [Colwellia sp.]
MLKKMISCIVAFSVLSTMFHLNKTHAADIDNGNKITQLKELHKVVINEQLSIDIYVPQGDRTSGKQYPTMYVMDGKYYFYNAIAFQKSLRHNVNKSPEFIVVGININDLPDNPNLRRELLGDSADKMISLLENQVFPYVDKHFPSNHTRMYFGWQFAAGFGLELFSKRPNLIEGYFLASSPMFSDKRIPRLADTLQKHKGLNNYFYLTLGETELHATSKHHTLSKLLKQHEQNGIKSHYNLSDNHNHQTTPLDSFTSGLEWYFSDFPDMTFYSVDDVGKFGGASAVKEYYNNRGSRYNISPKVGKQARFSMFRHAAKEDDWETFQSFERELGEYELTDKSSEYWFKFFGQFYQKNTPFRAEKLYKQAVEVHPTSHHLCHF